jgi:hypothetical protein
MALYYVVRVYTDNPRSSHSCLVSNNIESPPWGTTHATGPARRFLWKEEAEEALRVFMVGKDQPIYTYGRVYHVTEDPAGPPVTVDAAQQLAPIAPPQVAPCEPSTKTIDLSVGEALLNHKDHGRSLEVDEPLYEWLFENAKTLLQAARGYERLDWLRQHPESCRALQDCRNTRKKGIHFCEACDAKGVGGYSDVYQDFYTSKFNQIMEDLVGRITAAQAAGKSVEVSLDPH